MTDLLLRSATLADGTLADIGITQGVIEFVTPPGGQSSVDTRIVDMTGRVVTRSLVEPHAHLDKAFLADRIANTSGDLMGAIIGLQRARHSITPADIEERAMRAVQLMSRNGVTAVRTHADTTLDNGLESVISLLNVRSACSHFLDLQVAALVEWPLTGRDGANRRALARDAIEAGANVIGGCPHLDPDPRGALEFLLELAIDSGTPLDLHADENMRPDSIDLEIVSDMLLSSGARHPVVASHCVSMSIMNETRARAIAAKAASAGVSVVALPQTNLYLQARGLHTNTPRGITPISILKQEGVNVCAGADNLQDPFNPVGRGDPLETASLLVIASHISPADAFEMVSQSASATIGSRPVSVKPGDVADLVGITSTTLRESVATATPDRIVVCGGVVVDAQRRNEK